MHPAPSVERIDRGEYMETTVNSIVCFEPLNPVTPGHMLFVPRAHAMNAAASPRMAGDAVLAASQYLRGTGCDANIITSIGPHATQTVCHTHVHLVPRIPGDGLHLPWSHPITVRRR